MSRSTLSELRVDPARLLGRIQDMARIGSTVNGGSNRQALTDEDANGRELFASWCEGLGCEIRIDSIGNMFARREGSDRFADPVLVGSHLDTQPTGGKYDGVYGVLAGVEIIETLNSEKVVTEAPIEVIVWTNEEGCRFDMPAMGSSVWAGVLKEQDAYREVDRSGCSVLSELNRTGYLGQTRAAPFDFRAAFELHIEQGPVLEKESKAIGVVTSTQNMSRHTLKIFGSEAHAGTTPMSMRKDPVMAISEMLPQFYAAANSAGPSARITFGQISCSPGVVNTVPGEVEIKIDLRHPCQVSHDELAHKISAIADACCKRFGVEFEIEKYWEKRSVEFDMGCRSSVKRAADLFGYQSMEIVSGALHDACNLALHGPTSMIFIPCKNGISHNEAEHADLEHIGFGANVLLHSVLDYATPKYMRD